MRDLTDVSQALTVALNENAKPEDLRFIAKTHTDPEIRLALAENPATPDDILLALADDPDPEIRDAVASNSSAPRKAFEKLVHDPSPRVRWTICFNHCAPKSIVAKLLDDPDESLVYWTLVQGRLPAAVLRKYANHPEYAKCVIENDRTPVDVLEKLALTMPYEEIISHFQCNHRVPDYLWRFLKATCEVKDIETKTLILRLLGDELTGDDLYAACDRLSSHPSRYVREFLAWLDTTPPDILARFYDDDCYRVVAALARNPNTPPQILADLVNVKNRKWDWSRKDALMITLATNPSTPPEALDILANPSETYLCELVARNRRASRDTLVRLTRHQHPYVRKAATETLRMLDELNATASPEQTTKTSPAKA